MMKRRVALVSLVGLMLGVQAWAADNTAPEGFISLFNGKDLRGWKVPAGDNGHWKVVDGVIDYDAQSEAAGDKSLWSDREYGDFILHGLAPQRGALPQQECSLHLAGWHPRARRSRHGAAPDATGCGLR